MKKVVFTLLLLCTLALPAFAQQTASKQFTLTVSAGTLSLSPASLPTGAVSMPYNAAVSASGGVAPYSYGVSSGSLPAGISLNPSTGALSGTPTGVVVATFTITASDSETPPASVAISYTITVNSPLGFSTTSLPTAAVGAPYNAPITLTGGVPPYTCSVSSGLLPAGLSLSSSGPFTISGTPVASGSFIFTLTAKDASNATIRASGRADIK